MLKEPCLLTPRHFHTVDIITVRNLIRGPDWSTRSSYIVYSMIHERQTKGRNGPNVNAINPPQTSQYSLNIDSSLEEA